MSYFVEPIIIERETPGLLDYKEFNSHTELCGYYNHAIKEKGAPKLSIAIMSHQNLSSLKVCVECVLKFAEGTGFELVLMDNASEDNGGTYNFMQEVPYSRKKIIKMVDNMGPYFNAPRGWGTLWPYCTGDYILHLNDDHYITENSVQNMIKALDYDHSIGMVNPVSSNAWMMQDPQLRFETPEEMFEAAKAFNVFDPRKWEERIYVAAVAWMFRREILPYMACPNPFGPELCYDIALRSGGYRIMLLVDTWVHHNHDYSKKESYGFTGNSAEKIRQQEYVARMASHLSFGLTLFQDICVFEKRLVLFAVPPKNEVPSLLSVDVCAGQGLLDLKNQLRKFGIFNTVCTSFSTQAKYYPLLYTIADEVIIDRIELIDSALGDRRFDYCIVGSPINFYPDFQCLLSILISKLKPGGQLLYKIKETAEPYSEGCHSVFRSN